MKNNLIQIFNSNEFGDIRVTDIKGNPFFNLKDVCRILDIKNPSDAKTRLSQGGVVTTEVGVQTGIKSNGTPAIQKVQATFINESNLYKLIFQSRKPQAERFTDWVTSEVLPSIRKHGMYAKDELLNNPDLLIQVATKLKEEREQRLLLEKQLEKQKPLVVMSENFLQSKDSIDMNDMAKVLKDEGVAIGRNRLFKFLREQKILMGDNIPYQKYMERDYFEVIETIKNTISGTKTFRQTLVKPKGQMFISNLVREKYLDKEEN